MFDYRPKRGQVAHLDGDRNNNQPENLAWMCLEHHDEYDSQTSQSRRLSKAEAVHFRDEVHQWVTAQLQGSSLIIRKERIDIRGATPISISYLDRATSPEIEEKWRKEYSESAIPLEDNTTAWAAEWVKSEHGFDVATFDDTIPEYISFSLVLEACTQRILIRERNAMWQHIRNEPLSGPVRIRRLCIFRAIRQAGYTGWCSPQDAKELTPIELDTNPVPWSWTETTIQLSDLRIDGEEIETDEELELLILKLPTEFTPFTGDWQLRALEVRQL